VDILFQSHDISQGMDLLPNKTADVTIETLKDSQYGSRIVALGIWA